MTIPHIHSSSYAKSPASVLETALDFYMKQSVLITLTEVRVGKRVSTLPEQGWGYFHGDHPQDQTPVLWDNSRFKFIAGYSYLAFKGFYSNSKGKPRRAPRITAVVLEDRETGKRLLVIVVHPPASIEGHTGPGHIWDPKVPSRVLAAQATIAKVKVIKRELRRKHKTDGVMVVGDWNLNILRPAVRAYFKALFPRAEVNWKMNTKNRGTLGRRYIDFALLWGLKVLRGPTSHPTASSDHRYFRQVLEWD